MNWVFEHWTWFAGALAVLFILRAIGRKAVISAALMALDDLERMVEQRVGRYFSNIDCRKIAVGMLAILMAKQITVDQVQRSPGLMDAVMLESIRVLAQQREIAPPPQAVTASVRDV